MHNGRPCGHTPRPTGPGDGGARMSVHNHYAMNRCRYDWPVPRLIHKGNTVYTHLLIHTRWGIHSPTTRLIGGLWPRAVGGHKWTMHRMDTCIHGLEDRSYSSTMPCVYQVHKHRTRPASSCLRTTGSRASSQNTAWVVVLCHQDRYFWNNIEHVILSYAISRRDCSSSTGELSQIERGENIPELLY